MKRYFLTGTDTDAGKTLITAALLNKAKQAGKSCLGLKPVASGSDWLEEQLKNTDALLHQTYSNPSCEYGVHNPIALEPAIAPHIAAEQAGIGLSVHSLMDKCQPALNQTVDLQITEGAGGWLVPLNPNESLADFAKALDCPVIMVVGMKLGCINHACLTAEKILSDGLQIAGWVANHIDPHMDVQKDNLDYLTHWFTKKEISRMGAIPYFNKINPFDTEELSQVSELLSWP